MDITNQIFYTWKVIRQAERPEHISPKSGHHGGCVSVYNVVLKKFYVVLN